MADEDTVFDPTPAHPATPAEPPAPPETTPTPDDDNDLDDNEVDTDEVDEVAESVSGYDDVTALFEELAAAGDDPARRATLRAELIHRCIPLADHIARKFSGRGEPFDDLTQVARVGLVHAVDRFDIARGSNFLSFAVPTIMGEVRRYFRDNTWAMRVPRRVKETHLRIGAAIDALSQTLGRSPTAKEIATELGISADEVTQAVIAGNAYQPSSIDAVSVGRDSEASLLDTLGEEESQFDRVEEYVAIRPLLAGLPERERRILTMRFFESMTQTQIAQRMGISQMHVSRILAKTLARLREQSARE
ncbi:RNA polymerase sigma factor SigF [Nocardia sp. CDC159]|uniref:RNA polymerase sigma factor SigF n=1 Tax=Nocardia pulmonis TaxID=2951408 RepID=A0A9X2IYT5_9NOCA|nr:MULTISPECIES: RNA polymerase sigma factor SigF [Nocardia]MCM6776753.1 RNA polymerase sigma factor SigF [Nocardia pulmonis]MCM6789098.1 RNA polymerase sigma factor SigF [Nocardia sp. CDC159]